MGYEPHIVKVPVGDARDYRDKAMACTSTISMSPGTPGVAVAAGCAAQRRRQPHLRMYDGGSYPINELAAGSCLVKPTDFDLPALADHEAACYIATPVLKCLDTLEIPGIDLGAVQSLWGSTGPQLFHLRRLLEGRPDLPEDINNGLFGRSPTRRCWNGSPHSPQTG